MQNVSKLIFLTAIVSAQEGSGQQPIETTEQPAAIGFERFGRPDYGQYGNYDDYEEADLGHFLRTGSPFTSCRVGSHSTGTLPSVDCALDEVCQITFEYRRGLGGSFKRFYRTTCKGQKQCEVKLIRHAFS